MADNSLKPTIIAVLGGVVAALVTTSLTGEVSRTQSLRNERRAAYAQLLGTAWSCNNETQYMQMRLDQVLFVAALSAPGAPQNPLPGTELIDAVIKCDDRIAADGAKVRVLSDDPEVITASRNLTNSIPRNAFDNLTTKEQRDKEYGEYMTAYYTFESAARRDTNSGSIFGFKPYLPIVLLILSLVAMMILMVAGLKQRHALKKIQTQLEQAMADLTVAIAEAKDDINAVATVSSP